MPGEGKHGTRGMKHFKNKHAHAIHFTHMSHTIMKLAQTSAPKLDFPKIAGPGSSNRSGPDCRNAE